MTPDYRMADDGLALLTASFAERPWQTDVHDLRSAAIEPLLDDVERLAEALVWLAGMAATVLSAMGEALGMTDHQVLDGIVTAELAARVPEGEVR